MAKKLAQKIKGGDIIALTGPLGAGKTTFAQYFAAALGVMKNVKSPSFNIMHIHKIKNPLKSKVLFLCHLDCYRLINSKELEIIGLDDWLGDKKTITIIEWADKIRNLLPPQTIWINFTFNKSIRRGRISKTAQQHN